MNPRTDEEYVNKSGTECPFCASLDVEGQGFNVDGKTASQEVVCNTCHRAWWDVYELQGYEEMEE